jgi:site-specific DNA-cytosine methylase
VFTSKEDRDFIRSKWKENSYFEDSELPHKMIRPMTCLECERLQTLPDNYTDCIESNIARKEAIGNGWTIDVICHIFKGLKEIY